MQCIEKQSILKGKKITKLPKHFFIVLFTFYYQICPEGGGKQPRASVTVNEKELTEHCHSLYACNFCSFEINFLKIIFSSRVFLTSFSKVYKHYVDKINQCDA